MPTYEYHCDACDHRFDEFQTMTEKPLKTCPSCGRPKLRRLFGAGAAVLFKGSGFYETDYRSESYKAAAKADAERAKAADGKTDPDGKFSRKTENSSSSAPASASKKAKSSP
ncbi:MAG: zinc ribbon domain-containing protein [Gemmataceae bacterium]|nr:zinc ribbon domain-containing protein [Gemmataceae bacterium]MDW8264346.1 zinc ribbon domain-containing protein [Gemmataceae bacterium]